METRKVHLLKKENQGESHLSRKAGGAKEGAGRKLKVYERKDPQSPAVPFLPSRILSLQRSIGNRAVERWLKSWGIQARLKVSDPGDPYEKEADRVADQVMRMTGPARKVKPGLPLARSPSCGEEEAVQSQCQPLRITPLVQGQVEEEKEDPTRLLPGVAGYSLMEGEEETTIRAEAGSKEGLVVQSNLESRINALTGGGQALPESVRAFFESRFGADFSQVRVHSDARAAETTKALNAKAFTVRRDLVFGEGKYSPDSADGKRLLSHELAHVVQQRGTGLLVPNQSRGDKTALAVQRQEARKEGKPKIKYSGAKKMNIAFAHRNYLGWETKLELVAGGAYKSWAELWKEKKYEEFADAVAAFQKRQNYPEKEIDGILGLKTWGAIGGLGEVMAGIKTVRGEAENVCTLATRYRIERAHKVLGKSFGLPGDKDLNTYNIILQSIPNRMLDIDEEYRGAGAAGAIVYAGIGTFVPEGDIWNGKLKPGAAIQAWGSKADYDLLKAGEKEEDGKKRRIHDGDAGFYGTSMVFVRYDTDTNERLLVRHFGDTQWKRKNDFAVWVAANIG